ncbi:MAG: hypothetical protein AAGC74_01830, partial [Verrucomicrobiota bacterium]
EQLFASTHEEMAEFHRGRAEQMMARRQDQRAGESMQAMAYHKEREAKWSREPLTAAEKQEVKNLRKVGTALRTGTGYLVKGSGYVLQGTGWVLGKGFQFLSRKGDAATGNSGKIMRGTGQGGETGSRWIENAGNGVKRMGDWMMGR